MQFGHGDVGLRLVLQRQADRLRPLAGAKHEIHGEEEQQDARTEERPCESEPAEQESGEPLPEDRAELVAGAPDPEIRPALGAARPVREQGDVVRPARRLREAVDAHRHAHPEISACDLGIDEQAQHDVARSRDAHAPRDDAPALRALAEPGREELAQHVRDEVDRPRIGDLDVVEPEMLLQRKLDDRIDLPDDVEAAVGKPGRDEQLHAIAAQQLRVRRVQVNDLPARSRRPSASSSQKSRRQSEVIRAARGGERRISGNVGRAAGDEHRAHAGRPRGEKARLAVLEHQGFGGNNVEGARAEKITLRIGLRAPDGIAADARAARRRSRRRRACRGTNRSPRAGCPTRRRASGFALPRSGRLPERRESA